MALGGGTWLTQAKTLPGTYVNFSSAARASAALSERGYAAMPLMLDWGADNAVFTVTGGDFQKNSLKLFGHAYTDEAMLPLRELFKYAQTLYAYRLNGGGTKAASAFCTAKYTGTAGNRISTAVAVNVDDNALFDVSTYVDAALVDAQTVAAAGELKANDFVDWKTGAALAATAKTPLTGGTNGTVNAAAWQAFLDKIESYSFNALGCPSDDAATVGLFVNFTKRMRDEVGTNFQTVVFSPLGAAKAGDYEGVVEVGSKAAGFDSTVPGMGQYGLVYWVTGACAGCAVNKSNTNKRYDGELTVDVDHTQADLEAGIRAGRFMFHNVGGEVRVLEDINSLVTVSDARGDVFKANQTVRVCDQIANDIATLFNTRYLGVVPNDANGRVALWNDICRIYQALEAVRAIERFDPDTVSVEQGDSKKTVVCTTKDLNVINAMAQLYLSVVVI